jgi:hypothetical protein
MLMGLVLAVAMLAPRLTLAAGPAPVDLGTAGHFTLLSGAAITSGGGAVTGDVGAYPIAGSSIGIPPVQVTGIIYRSDGSGTAGPNVVFNAGALLLAAKNDLTTAYNNAAARLPVPSDAAHLNPGLIPGSGNIGGMNLSPGLYKFTVTANIQGADLILTGGPDDVWIFQCQSDLEVGVGRQVILAGDAQARNVFWQVGSSATIFTSAVMKGTIMAYSAITMQTSSMLEGRALAEIAAIDFSGTSASLPSAILTVVASPTNGGVVTGSGTFLVGSTNPISATPASNWSFLDWNDGNTNQLRNIVLLSNTTYTAFFVNTNAAPATITVVASPTNAGTVTGNGSFPIGFPDPLSATASNGWRFVQWSDGVSTPQRTVVVLSNATYTALFTTNTSLLFYQDSSDTVARWVLNSTGVFQSASILGNTAGWELKAAGDINGDGISDLLFETAGGDTAIWFLNADGSIRSARQILPNEETINPAWQIVAAGDWAGLGNAQVFFQTAAGDTAYWVLDTNGNFLSSVYLGNEDGWKLRGVGYLYINGDPQAELLWQNAAGQFAAWYHQSAVVYGEVLPYTIAGGWQLHGVVDVNGDGVSELVWQDPYGNVGNWFMHTNGTVGATSPVGNAGVWKLKGAGH